LTSSAYASEKYDWIHVAREIVRLQGGELWAEKGVNGRASTSMMVLPLQFPSLSHAILASSARCFEPE